MAEFTINNTITTNEPEIEVTISPNTSLPVGRHRFQLVVEDDSGNVSQADAVDIIVRDTQAPTAVLDADPQAEYGRSFNLSGRRSSDVAPGRVVSYHWTRIPILERPPIIITPITPVGGNLNITNNG